MSGVPYTFGNATTTIALSNLDTNFATPATLGNTTVGLGNTTTTVGNLTLVNATISSLASQLPASAMPTGSVVQVVNVIYSTPVSTTSVATMVNTGLTASITPQFSTSKILILIHHNGVYRGGTIYAQMDMQFLRNSTVLTSMASASLWNGNFAGLTTNYGTTLSIVYLDSPATTSSTTYSTQYQISPGGSGTVGLQNGNTASTITLMEIR